MERFIKGVMVTLNDLPSFDNLLGALKFTNAIRHEQLTAVYITYGPDQRYYVANSSSYSQLNNQGHELISHF